MKAIFACANFWGTPFHVGSHEIARVLLERGWEIAFVAHPISPAHGLKGMDKNLMLRVRAWMSGGTWLYGHRLFTYVPFGLLTPARKPALDSVWLQRNWYRWSVPSLLSKARAAGFSKVDLVYADGFYHCGWLEKIQYKKSVFRVTDKMDAFQSATKASKEIARDYIKHVDCVVYSASNLRAYVEEMRPKKAVHLPNGVNADHFISADKSLPREFQTIPSPRVIFVGAMEEWFDYEAVRFFARRMPYVSFVLIGNDHKLPYKNQDLSNLYHLGTRSYADIPRYIANADVGIIPFRTRACKDLVDHVNPLKLYEYMACGLPVVASAWEELRHIASPAYLYETYDEGAAWLERALRAGRGNRDAYIRYAKQQDWTYRVDVLLHEVGL